MNSLLAHAKNNAVAYVALFVALGGTGYAAINLPAGSVGSRQLRAGSVTESKLAGRSVSAAKLDPKSIAGYVAFWAQIQPGGQVIASSPRATVVTHAPSAGVQEINWNRVIPRQCFALATVTNLLAAAGYANAYIDRRHPAGGRSDVAVAQTFNGSGQNVPEPVNVGVICP